jgi:hypothetical protein
MDYSDDEYSDEPEWEVEPGLSGPENSGEDSDELSVEDDALRSLVGARILQPKMSEESSINEYMDPHWNDLIDAKNSIIDTIKEEKRVYYFVVYKVKMSRNYGMRKPMKNELIKLFEIILDFLERLSMARGKFPGPAFRIWDYFSLLEEQLLPHLREPWSPNNTIDYKLDALNLDKTALKSILRYYGQVLARIKNHFGPGVWPAEKKAPSSLLKTFSSSSVIASEVISTETPSVDSSDGIFTALNTKNIVSANRSPQITRTSLDSPSVQDASTVGEIASKFDEELNGSSPNTSSEYLGSNSMSAQEDAEEDEIQGGSYL